MTYKAVPVTVVGCISEIFSSIQGEGPFVGVRQIFVRFSRCNLNCYFCDERGNRTFNDISAEDLLRKIKKMDSDRIRHHSISLTGGEPLVHIDFLKRLLPILKKEKFKIYLETNGTLPGAFKEIMKWVDIVAMDIKLPSATRLKSFWREHEEFLKLARTKEMFIKAVVTGTTKESDIAKAVSLIHNIDKDILMILQPATPTKPKMAVKPRRLMKFLFLAEERLPNVRIIPQVHKLMNVR